MSTDASRARTSAPDRAVKTSKNSKSDNASGREDFAAESFHNEAHEELDAKGYARVNKPVFIASGILIVGFVLWSAIFPDQAETVIFGSMDWIGRTFGWYYVLTAALIVVFVLSVALSKFGDIRLGPDHSRPQFSLFTWASMLFAAGIGVDLMFFAVSGPATNFLTPPDNTPLSDEAARMAPVWTIFHYGIPGWSMYALMGVALGLAAYRYHLPLSIRSALAPLFGKRIKGAAGDTVDVVATIGTIFGIGTSLGIGVVFLNYGLSALFDIPNNITVWTALIVVSVTIATISAVSGVDKGIRRLSELNVFLALGLLLYILLAGDTAQLLKQLVQNAGDSIARLPSMLFATFGYSAGAPDYPADQWLQDWTVFFWAWWIAWAPFVGLFLTRISRGRTLREFIIGVLIVPPGFILLFISIFSNSALAHFQAGDDAFLNEAVEVPESGFFNLLSQYPGATFLIGLAVIVGLLFYVTSADSGSLVMANMTSYATRGDTDGAPWLRIFWAVVIGALTLAMLLVDGVYTLQAATVLIGLPFSVVMYLLMASVLKVLRAEKRAMNSHELTMASRSMSGSSTGDDGCDWKERLARRVYFPTRDDAVEFMENVAGPAVREVAAELEKLGTEIQLTESVNEETHLPFIDLTMGFTDHDEFKYQLVPLAYEVPSYATNAAEGQEYFYRVEVFNARGTRGHNVIGYTHDQVIQDVISFFDRHLVYMDMADEASGHVIADSSVPAPTKWDDAGANIDVAENTES
ncbi:choline BCCT transporter BetT [Corynebacterium sp. P3-F1]|uniref:choline BCCT transporter BetT n=1 Tax=Corynebacterium sp. P3-F1 TaxID=3059080 RepID=UPI00265D28A0|nr:choline BCCT transporter BetT [Corynebacterium sp. P3-F1]WKK60967.1 choline BCCT transporter BetT [Corynebacterium sp. P3-F1]